MNLLKTPRENKFRVRAVVGTLKSPLSWFPEAEDPGIEASECRIEIICPDCGRVHQHGWKLSGELRLESRMPHCDSGIPYTIRPATRHELAFEIHEYSPYTRLARPSRRRKQNRRGAA